MSSQTVSQSPRAVLRLPEFRSLMGARLTNAVAASALATVVGFQVYQLTRDPLSLGLLGLVEAIPALSLSIIGGHVADRHDRRSIVLITSATLVVLVGLLAVIANSIAGAGDQLGLGAILAVIFVSGIASGFERPAFTAFEAQVIPIEQVTVGTSIASSVWITGAIAGPALGGIAVAIVGLPATYALLAVLLAISTGCIALIPRKPMPTPEPGERIRDSLRVGVRFVFRSQVLWGSMALDLFAVLFGGVVALLPIFADILGVGPVGLGLMRTAPSAGALLSTIVATRLPPRARAGRTLLVAVAGFGISILVFAVSTNFILSMFALFMTGVTDGVSMVIRNVTVRIYSP
jgi:MFS family permease